MKHARTLLAAAVAISLAGTSAWAIKLGDLVDKGALDQIARDKLGVKTDGANPTDAAVPLAGDMNDADEEKLGREVAGRLLGAVDLVKDDKLQQYVNKVGRYVAAQSGRADLHWTFGVIDSSDVNAFAAPGGYIFLTRGLYAMLQNEAELAGVLGHEIAHVNRRHHVKLMQKQRAVSLGQELLMKKAGSDSVKALVGNGAEIYARALDKGAEYESDRIGVQYAAKAGYDGFALAAVLDRMAVSADADRFTLLYKTHPLPSQRLDALEKSIGARFDALPAGATLESRLYRIK